MKLVMVNGGAEVVAGTVWWSIKTEIRQMVSNSSLIALCGSAHQEKKQKQSEGLLHHRIHRHGKWE